MVTGTTKIAKKENLMSHFWEAIQAIKVKFLRVTYVHLGYPHTEFRPGHVRNFGELIWNYPLLCPIEASNKQGITNYGRVSFTKVSRNKRIY